MQNQPSGIRDNKCQLGVGRAHTIHPGGGFADAHRAMLLYQLTFQSQHIAGHNLAAETGIFYPAKQGNLSTVFRQAQCGHRAGLGKGFQNQYPRHNRMAGEMSLEKRLCAGHAFDAPCPLAGGIVKNLIHQSKRVTVRQDLFDFRRRQGPGRFIGCIVHPHIENAQGCNVRYGIAPDKLYQSWLVYDADEVTLSTLMAGQTYYVCVDSFNENGITTGRIIKMEG